MRGRSARTRAALVALVLASASAACSDGGGGDEDALSTEEQAYADAFSSRFSGGEGGFGVDEVAGACMGAAIVAELGIEAFEDAGVTPQELEDSAATPGSLLGAGTVSADEAGAIADGWRDCVDFEAAYAAHKADAFGLEAGPAVDCFAAGMRDAGFLDALVDLSFAEAEPDPSSNPVRDLVVIANGCGTGNGDQLVEQLAALFVARGSLDETQAACVARGVMDLLGVDRFLEMTAGSGAFDAAPPEVQQELTRAVLDATKTCGVPLAQQAGG